VSKGYQQIYGENENDIARTLGNTGERADFVGWNPQQGRWLIAESKGGDIQTGVDQLRNAAEALLKHNPAARTADIDFRLYLNEQQFARYSQTTEGYRILEGRLGYFDYNVNLWVWELIEDRPIEVYVAP